jgi:hypothetical protein
MAVLLLLQVPPEKVLISAAELPLHTAAVPVMAAGSGLTDTLVVAMHPPDTVYETKTTAAFTPYTVPEGSTVAMAGLLVFQVPPGTASLKLVDELVQTAVVPVIEGTAAVTVVVVNAIHPVPAV